MKLTLDHLAVAAESLEEGAAAVKAALGVPLAPGGVHPNMGTHNRLLSLGPTQYLEVIAIDPAATAPDRPRWFNLDNFRGSPRLTNWIARCDNMQTALQDMPDGSGQPSAQKRGDLRWKMAIPDDGKLPFDGLSPALIEWGGASHPAQMLPDLGCRLEMLEIEHPQGDKMAEILGRMMEMSNIRINKGPVPRMKAAISTPNGHRILS